MKQDPIIISHLYNNGQWNVQTNKEHCEGVAKTASEFASEFGMSEWGRMLGLLHDRGKEGYGFQAYIKRVSGYDPKAFCDNSKDHSYIGAVIAHRLPFDQFYWISNAIAGHHRGLYDIDELELTLKKEIPQEVSQIIPDIHLTLPPFKLEPKEASHLSRMLFSCLVDADWLDTEKFMQPGKALGRSGFSSLEELSNRMDVYLKSLKSIKSTPLNDIRNEIQEKCMEASSLEPGFFDLTVPTGGGKTIASVVWAIRHALKNNKKRIIIAIPFTSIIVQTASVLRNIFGNENVIEHHSVTNDYTIDARSSLACENWDAPIIVTTNVQLFESMFSNRPSVCRKLHSIANSVVILDEVQTIPLTFLQPIVNGLKTYVKLFGTSFLFCTASQPILDGKRNGCNGAYLIGIEHQLIRHIVKHDMNLHQKLCRVKLTIDKTRYTYESLATTLKKHKRILCIVSSRRHAIELYNELLKESDIPTFHLSRSMCPAHILEKINEIKNILSDPLNEIRVVSTQLIEAGVDIDFPIVYRQLAGLDSIIQAAGRCNREGKLKEGQTIVFSFKEEHQHGFLRFASDTMKDMIALHPDADWFSPDILRLYNKKLYQRTPSFDKEGIEGLLDNPNNCQFEEASKKFSLINEDGINVIINFGDSEKLIKQLIDEGPSRKLSRQLGKLSVNIPQMLFNDFRKDGIIEEPFPGFFFIPLRNQYDNSFGLKTKNEYIEQTFII